MTEPTRRTILKVVGASSLTVAIAGCSGDDDAGGEDDGGNDDSGGEEEEEENGGGADGFEMDPGTDIRLDGQTAGWEGLEPAAIEGEQNPTLVLQEGEDYTIGWTQGDGANHNIEIRDDSDDIVDDLVTEQVADPGDDQILEFTASSEMASYVCDPHEMTMNGDIVVQ